MKEDKSPLEPSSRETVMAQHSSPKTRKVQQIIINSKKDAMLRMRKSSQFVIQKMEEFYNQQSDVGDEALGEDDNQKKVKVLGSTQGTLRPGILSDSYKMCIEINKQGVWMEKHVHVKINPGLDARFFYGSRRNRTLHHEIRVYNEYMKDLQAFITARVGDRVKLDIPQQYIGQDHSPHTLVVEDLGKVGFTSKDWLTQRLTEEEVAASLSSVARFHAAGVAYRMSMKTNLGEKYPWLLEDLFTSNTAKELLAKYLDSYLHYLSLLPGNSVARTVLQIRKIQHKVFDLIVSLRRPTDSLGSRFQTVCHGDLWMGNLMFRQDEESLSAIMVDFHSCVYMSPVSDLAHLLLTSTSQTYLRENWDHLVEKYYETFNTTLMEFGLNLKHLGTSYKHFKQEVRRAVAGQFLCVALVIPIVVVCGPEAWGETNLRRTGATERQNTVRSLMQMMSIKEDDGESDPEIRVPALWQQIHSDERLRGRLVGLLETADDMDLLQWGGYVGKPPPSSSTMRANTAKTTAKVKPEYGGWIQLERPTKEQIPARKRTHTV